MPHCDICRTTFPSCDPSRDDATPENSWNPAVIDAQIRGLGVWGYLCESHRDYATPGTATDITVILA